MTDKAHTAYDMISGMTPVLQSGDYVFVTTTDTELGARLTDQALCTYREHEGLSLLLSVADARTSGFEIDAPMRCITLNVYSSLEGVGLTAAVASALSQNDIPCNMIAAYHHDHAFVPAAQAERAMDVLVALQNRTSGQS